MNICCLTLWNFYFWLSLLLDFVLRNYDLISLKSIFEYCINLPKYIEDGIWIQVAQFTPFKCWMKRNWAFWILLFQLIWNCICCIECQPVTTLCHPPLSYVQWRIEIKILLFRKRFYLSLETLSWIILVDTQNIRINSFLKWLKSVTNECSFIQGNRTK